MNGENKKIENKNQSNHVNVDKSSYLVVSQVEYAVAEKGCANSRSEVKLVCQIFSFELVRV